MEWESWQAFWDMGGYGAYVWGSFAVTALVIAGELLLLRHRQRTAQAVVRRIRSQENARRGERGTA